jgi:DNA replication protein DnaC
MNKCLRCGVEVPTLKANNIRISPKVCFDCGDSFDRERDKEAEQKRKQEIIYHANLPKEYHKTMSHFNNIDLSKQQKSLKKIIDGYNPESNSWKLPFVFGPPGSGKTFMAYYTIKTIIKKHTDTGDVYFTTMAELIAKMRKNIHEGLPNMSTHFLVIDDLCAHTTTNWVLEKLYMLLDYRIKNEKPTFFTSNIKPTEISKSLVNSSPDGSSSHVCEAIQDRILGLCIPIGMKNKSYRLEDCLTALKAMGECA